MPYKLVVLLLLFSLGAPVAAFAAQQGTTNVKPRSPLAVTIRPVQRGLTSSAIKAGDTVQLDIVAVSHIGLSRADLRITLTGGAKLVAGENRWSGPMEKGRETVITVTVKAPSSSSGKGWVKAALSSGGLHAGAEFSLGPEAKTATRRKSGVKNKDSKGQDIIEYR